MGYWRHADGQPTRTDEMFQTNRAGLLSPSFIKPLDGLKVGEYSASFVAVAMVSAVVREQSHHVSRKA